MQQKLQNRLKELKAEFEAGKKQMVQLDARRAELHETMLRISGAIQVLEEELGNESDPEVKESTLKGLASSSKSSLTKTSKPEINK